MKKTVIIGIICGLVLSGSLIYILYNDTSLRYNVGTLTGVNYSSDGYLYVISYLNNGAIYKIKLN